MLADVGPRLFLRVDLASELIRLRFHTPVNMRGHEHPVVIVGFATGIKDSDLSAHVLEKIRIEWRFAYRQGRAVELVLLIFAERRRLVALTRLAGRDEAATRDARRRDNNKQDGCRFHI